jgi:hypothetical protein
MLSPLWTLPLDETPRGLALPREAGGPFVWTEQGGLVTLDRKGTVQARTRLGGLVTTAAAADDGSGFAAAADGQFGLFAPDLRPRWQRPARHPITALALDSFGRFLAAADAQGRLELFDRDGKRVAQVESPRPLHHLAFVPGAPALVGAAEFGLLARLDLPAAEWGWRTGVAAHVGGLAVPDSGDPILVACFSAGLRHFSGGGKSLHMPALPCRALAVTHDARLAVLLGLDDSLTGLTPTGESVFTARRDRPVAGLALAPLGDVVYLATADGAVEALAVADPRPA